TSSPASVRRGPDRERLPSSRRSRPGRRSRPASRMRSMNSSRTCATRRRPTARPTTRRLRLRTSSWAVSAETGGIEIMGGNGYKMNFGTVDAAGTDLVRGAGNIETKLGDMETALKPLQADWTGSASEAYIQAKAKWNTALTEMKVLL